MMNKTIESDAAPSAAPELVVPPGTRRVVVVRIKPTSYVEDGFPYTFARGVLPSNSLAALYSLTRQELAQRLPTGIESEIHVFDEYVARNMSGHERLARRFPEAGTLLIVGFYKVRRYAYRRPGAPPLSHPAFLAQEAWRHVRYVGRLISEFYRFQHVVYETEFAPYLAERGEEVSGHVRGVRDWVRLTFGRVMTRRWLNQFWTDYGRQRWQLLINPLKYGWHFKMIPHAITEVVYSVRFAWMMLRATRMLTS